MAEEHVYTERLNLVAPKHRTPLGTLVLRTFLMPDGSVEIDQTTMGQPPFELASLQPFLNATELAELVAKRAAAAQAAGDFFSYMVAMAVEHGWRIRT